MPARTQIRRSPRDVTGKAWAEATEAAKKKKEALADPEALRKDGWHAGFDAGHEAGQQHFIDALFSLYKTEGLSAVQEFLDELDTDEQDAE